MDFKKIKIRDRYIDAIRRFLGKGRLGRPRAERQRRDHERRLTISPHHKARRAHHRDQGYRMFKSISTRKLSSQAARLSLPRNEVFVSG